LPAHWASGGLTGVIDEPCLRAWVRHDFGIDLTGLEKVHHGADSNADLWRGVSAQGDSYAIKLSGGGTAAGLIVSAELVRHGLAGVPAPSRTVDGRLWSERDDRRLSLVPWVSDERAYDGRTTAAHWRAFGDLLAGLHGTAVTEELARVLPRETHTHDKQSAITRALDHRLRGVTAGDDPLVRTVAREWFGADLVSTVLQPADALGAELRRREDLPYSICHADPHQGNLLLGKEGEVWLIDWDDVILAPRERDLMFVIGGVFGHPNEDQLRWFFEGYGEVRVDPARLAYYRCVRALEDVGAFAADVLNSEGDDRAEALAIVQGGLSPNGLVALAQSSVRALGSRLHPGA
jgi:Phosphotransferase enzyme family